MSVAAPMVDLYDRKGNVVPLSQMLARGPVVLAFFKITCPTCQFAFPFLNRISSTGKFQLFGVAQDDEEGTAEFISEFGTNFPVFLDPEDQHYPASDAFKITHVPTLFQIETDGTISHHFTGFSRKDLEQLGERAGIPIFEPTERLPEFRPG